MASFAGPWEPMPTIALGNLFWQGIRSTVDDGVDEQWEAVKRLVTAVS